MVSAELFSRAHECAKVAKRIARGEGESVCYHINDGDEKHCFLNLLVSWWDALDAARRHAPLQPPRWAWAPAYARTDSLARHPFSVAILRDTREPDHSMAERFANVGVASRAARSNPDGLLRTRPPVACRSHAPPWRPRPASSTRSSTWVTSCFC